MTFKICHACGNTSSAADLVPGKLFNTPLRPICAACFQRTLTEAVDRMGGDRSRLTADEWSEFVVLKGQKARGLDLTTEEVERFGSYRDRLFDPAKFWTAAHDVIAEATEVNRS